MKRVSPLTYLVDNGEQIIVRVIQSTGIAHLVSYSLDGTSSPGNLPKDAPCVITISKTSLLGMTCFFTDPEGGSFTSQVAGKPGGDPPDNVPYERSGTEAWHTRIFTFITPTMFADMSPKSTSAPQPGGSNDVANAGNADDKPTSTGGDEK